MTSKLDIAGLVDKFWLELREPHCVPERKGPWPHEMFKDILREFMEARPQAYITVVTVNQDGPLFQDAPEALLMVDGRMRGLHNRHIASSSAAHEALAQADAPDVEPVAYRWTTSDINGDDWPWTYTGKAGADIHSSHGHTVEPLYSAFQLSALQERAERAEANFREMTEKWRLASIDFDVADGRAEAAEARVAELEGRPDKNGFVIGHPVEKFTGEARWEGTLVASYLTTDGKRRYVVEVHPQGFQMIAVPAQLRMIAALTDDEAAALAHKGEGR